MPKCVAKAITKGPAGLADLIKSRRHDGYRLGIIGAAIRQILWQSDHV